MSRARRATLKGISFSAAHQRVKIHLVNVKVVDVSKLVFFPERNIGRIYALQSSTSPIKEKDEGVTAAVHVTVEPSVDRLAASIGSL